MKMRKFPFGMKRLAVSLSLALVTPFAFGDEDYDELKSNYESLKAEVEFLKNELLAMKKSQEEQAQPVVSQGTQDELSEFKEEIKAEIADLDERVDDAGEWKENEFSFHLAGYADVGYSNVNSGDDGFVLGHFAQIFHYQYKDIALFEGELAFEIDQEEDGSTQTEIDFEYLTVDLFLNDYMTLVAGKFFNPVGQFLENLHPSWINKLPSLPIGFGGGGGHGGASAAPVSEVGFQLRGGIPIAERKANYAFFVGNGPRLNIGEEDGEFEIEGVDTSGIVDDFDDNKSVGGRFGFLPVPNLEIGFSAAFAEAGIPQVEHGEEDDDDHEEPGAIPSSGEGEGGEVDLADVNILPRDYSVWGADFVYMPNFARNLQLRGEYVITELNAGSSFEDDSGEKEWEAWYVQGSYYFTEFHSEAVLRYGQFEDPHGAKRTQWAPGYNYLFANNLKLKLAYEFNDVEGSDEEESDDRFLVQLAFGF